MHPNGHESVVFLHRGSIPPPPLSLGDENHSFFQGNIELVLRAVSENQQLYQLEVTDLVWNGEMKTCTVTLRVMESVLYRKCKTAALPA